MLGKTMDTLSDRNLRAYYRSVFIKVERFQASLTDSSTEEMKQENRENMDYLSRIKNKLNGRKHIPR